MARNLTQMNLADAMGVSYQAVSNWERGNSMPDISKLEDLCRVLDIQIYDLLGMENREAATVSKILEDGDPSLTMEELSEIVPILPPAQVKEQVGKAEKKKMNAAALLDIVPYLDDELLEEIIAETEVESLKDLVPLAPYLDDDLLEKLVLRAPGGDRESIVALAPYLSEETLDRLARQCTWTAEDKSFLEELAPYLDEDTIDALTDAQIAAGNVKCLNGLYPYMDDKTLRKVARALLAQGDVEGLKEAAPFL